MDCTAHRGSMKPGEHTTFVGSFKDNLRAHRDLELRDTILVLLPGPRALTIPLFRSSVEGSVAHNVLSHGYGGLNIDGCRVRARGCDDDLGRTRRPSHEMHEAWHRPWRNDPEAVARHAENKRAQAEIASSVGRWPTNLILVHGPGCQPAGTLSLRGHNGTRGTDQGNRLYGGGRGLNRPVKGQPVGYAVDGIETAEAWDCQDDCPALLLDALSGERATSEPGKVIRRTNTPAKVYGDHSADVGRAQVAYGDRGGASRFFPQFPDIDSALAWIARLTGSG